MLRRFVRSLTKVLSHTTRFHPVRSHHIGRGILHPLCTCDIFIARSGRQAVRSSTFAEFVPLAHEFSSFLQQILRCPQLVKAQEYPDDTKVVVFTEKRSGFFCLNDLRGCQWTAGDAYALHISVPLLGMKDKKHTESVSHNLRRVGDVYRRLCTYTAVFKSCTVVFRRLVFTYSCLCSRS